MSQSQPMTFDLNLRPAHSLFVGIRHLGGTAGNSLVNSNVTRNEPPSNAVPCGPLTQPLTASKSASLISTAAPSGGLTCSVRISFASRRRV